ncbi:MAG: MarR family winged helix-turn-helix transcriptional regulator [Chloroflexota bacterium]
MTESLQFSHTVRQWMDAFMHRSMGSWARFVRASGFSMPQFMILMHAHYKESCGITDLSEKMDISTAAASQLVDKLVQAGLLVRAEDPHDRRARQVALTPKGRQLIEQGIQERYRWVEQLEANLTTAEKDKVNEALASMLRAMEDEK